MILLLIAQLRVTAGPVVDLPCISVRCPRVGHRMLRHCATLQIRTPTICSYRKGYMKKEIVVDHRNWWASIERTEYRTLGLSAELKKLPELSLRGLLGYLQTARSQHGDFAEYHERFHPGQAALGALAGARSYLHIFSTVGKSLATSGFGWHPTQR